MDVFSTNKILTSMYFNQSQYRIYLTLKTTCSGGSWQGIKHSHRTAHISYMHYRTSGSAHSATAKGRQPMSLSYMGGRREQGRGLYTTSGASHVVCHPSRLPSPFPRFPSCRTSPNAIRYEKTSDSNVPRCEHWFSY